MPAEVSLCSGAGSGRKHCQKSARSLLTDVEDVIAVVVRARPARGRGEHRLTVVDPGVPEPGVDLAAVAVDRDPGLRALRRVLVRVHHVKNREATLSLGALTKHRELTRRILSLWIVARQQPPQEPSHSPQYRLARPRRRHHPAHRAPRGSPQCTAGGYASRPPLQNRLSHRCRCSKERLTGEGRSYRAGQGAELVGSLGPSASPVCLTRRTPSRSRRPPAAGLIVGLTPRSRRATHPSTLDRWSLTCRPTR